MNTVAENGIISGQVNAHMIAHCIAQSTALAYVAGQAADVT